MNADYPSILLTSTTDLRNNLLKRNLYNPVSEYPGSQSKINSVVDAISSVASTLMPFKSIDLSNTVIGRLVTNQTPIAQIGLLMLGKQMALNATSHALNEVYKALPINLDAKSPASLFQKKYNFSITAMTTGSGLLDIIEKVTGNYAGTNDPFEINKPNSDQIKHDNFVHQQMMDNTGSGQLHILYTQTNYNQYKSDNLYDTATKLNEKIINIGTKNPYLVDINSTVINDHQEYGAKILDSNNISIPAGTIANYTIDNSDYGVTTKKTKIPATPNDWINNDDGFSKAQTIVWGDGTSKNTFGIQKGLLDYTNNLVSNSIGNINITNKTFTDKNGKHFNGSAVYMSPSNTAEPTLKGISGLREHTMQDPYDRYAKAIRFNGNKIYGGNPSSTIYKTVIPKFHPIWDTIKNKVDNTNLMFAIENLAYDVTQSSTTFLNLPESEKGPSNGRLMWFPPYNIKFNEVANAKFTTTPILGRSEPIYSYAGSERSGTLSFTLLVDYPQELSAYGYDSMGTTEKHQLISEFFTYGTLDTTTQKQYIDNINKRVDDINKQIDKIKFTPITEPEYNFNMPDFYFMNNYPTLSNIDTVFNDMYQLNYEIYPGFNTDDFGTGGGRNESIYDTTNIIQDKSQQPFFYNNTYPDEDQYNFTGECDLNTELNKFIGMCADDEDNIKYYSIYITSTTTALGSETSNTILSNNRSEATQRFISKRLSALYGQYWSTDSFDYTQVDFKLNPGGIASGNTDSTPNTINNGSAKEARVSTVTIERNSTVIPPKMNVLSNSDIEQIANLNTQKKALTDNNTTTKDSGRNKFGNIYKEKLPVNSTDTSKLISGSKTISDNYFNPVFHSQTPEDFHRRLTFLQQCMRQGSPQTIEGTDSIKNSIFGKQPILILKIGDFFNSKIIAETLTIDYTDAPWDLNPEGFGMQYMMCSITMNIKIIGGQSLAGPINILQNALSLNYYANSTYTNKDIYATQTSDDITVTATNGSKPPTTIFTPIPATLDNTLKK